MQELAKNTRLNKRKIGTKYEEIAVCYLISKGYKIIERNYRNLYGEIDILAKKDSTLLFFEVKFRSDGSYGDPLEAVNHWKQKRISKAALYYYAKNGYAKNLPCRFDVIAIYGDGTINHIENAFEFQW
ncbi:YraN family protein [Velocimicrobium porci]|uniref:UPF0102 protein FYJ58_08905 n=1 Tax=Velocimicrobium porci TaxID=2606634 RepID=A0A6L5XZU7_9FIRM|nr:YraN family protein [Velocimicrobium porci]MSS63991.1 YraN family protein [Velocimicrobium porci]